MGAAPSRTGKGTGSSLSFSLSHTHNSHRACIHACIHTKQHRGRQTDTLLLPISGRRHVCSLLWWNRCFRNVHHTVRSNQTTAKTRIKQCTHASEIRTKSPRRRGRVAGSSLLMLLFLSFLFSWLSFSAAVVAAAAGDATTGGG